MNFKSVINSNNYYNQYIIIHSGESFVYNATLALPFLIEDTVFNLRRPIYSKLDSKEKYELSLKYRMLEDVEKILPDEILSNLKENNVEIFKGTLETKLFPSYFKIKMTNRLLL